MMCLSVLRSARPALLLLPTYGAETDLQIESQSDLRGKAIFLPCSARSASSWVGNQAFFFSKLPTLKAPKVRRNKSSGEEGPKDEAEGEQRRAEPKVGSRAGHG